LLKKKTILEVIASVAFKSLKIINGMANIVMKLIKVDSTISKYCTPKYAIAEDKVELNRPISRKQQLIP
jgi:hypothetical protein